MKKLTASLLIVAIILSVAPVAFASDSIEVYLNGVALEKTGIIIADRTYLPVRALCEALNKSVSWDNDTKSVLIGTMPSATEKTDTINIYLDGNILENAQAIIINDSTYLPVRALCEALNMDVIWDGEKREVHVIEKLKLEYPIDIIAASEGFMLLTPTEKERFISYTTTTLPLGKLMRQKLTANYMNSYTTLSAMEQKTILLQVLAETAYFRTAYYGSLLPDGEKAKYEIVSKTFNSSYDVWRGTKKPVTIHHVKMESGYDGLYHEWNMISSADSPVVTDTIEAMSRFPYGVRRFVKTVIYDPNSSNICYGGGNTLWLRISWLPTEDQAARELLSCILGYVFDANITTDKTLWDDAIKSDLVPVSGFGNTNRVSDLGEFNALYHIAKNMENGLAELERVYPNRFALYASMLYSADPVYYSDYKCYFDEITATQQ